MVSKAPHVLLEAFRRLPAGAASVDLLGAPSDYHGDASYRDVLEPLLKLPGVNLRGPKARERVPEALRSLDVLVVPSVWPETSPLVIREAFLTGVPVVASNIGGMPELIEAERNGLLFEPGDVDGLALALKRLADDPGLLHRLKSGAAATPVRSLEDDVAATRGLYESFQSRIKPAPTTAPATRLAAIVLNYQTPADTAIAVASLMASDRSPDHLIVVDNDAGPECQNALGRWGDRITYLKTGANLGFAGGMNVGIRRALDEGACLVLLVNSDMVVPPDCIGRLEAAIKAGAGIAGPLVLSRSVPDMIGSAGIDYNAATGRMRHRGAGITARPAPFDKLRPPRAHRGAERTQPIDVDAVSGCLMLITRGVFDRIGLIDERYFFSFEEIDFCLRARAAGFRTQLAAEAVAYHEGGRAIGARSVRRLYFAARNHLMLAQRLANGDGVLKRATRTAFVVALNLAHAVRAPGGSLPARMGATLLGIRDYLAGRVGADRSA